MITKKNTNELEFLNDVFSKIEALNLDDIYLELPEFDFDKYPRIKFNFLKEDIESLSKLEDYQTHVSTALEKLFYSYLWKIGKIPSIHSLRDGLNGKDFGNTGLVMNQFGKHLADSKIPIIDQHVLRAFKMFKDQNVEKHSNSGSLTGKDKNFILKYNKWISEILDKVEKPEDREEVMYKIDKILFRLGKGLKKSS